MKPSVIAIGLVLLAFFCFAGSASALDPMPNKPGFSGFVRPGYAYLDIKSNNVANVAGFDLSKRTINSRNSSPRGESTGIVNLPFRMNYTLDNLKTQFFIGNRMMNLSRIDASQQLGIKQAFDGVGLFQAGLLFTSISTKVWKDPYLENANRKRTDRNATGIRLVWDKIMESDFELAYSYRKIDIDHDNSGQSVGGLTANQLKRLERDGNEHIIEALYRFSFGDNKHHLEPKISYKYDDRDGEALKNKEYVFNLTYTFLDDPITVIATGSIGKADYDKRNPIYGEKQEDDIYGVSATIYYKNPWGWTVGNSMPVNFYILSAYAERSADINFYYERAVLTSAGLMFRW